jgi:KAP family P-loop domain
MARNSMHAKMPEILVFAKTLVLGYVLRELFCIAYIGGSGLNRHISLIDGFDPVFSLLIVSIVSALLIAYSSTRGIVEKTIQLLRSLRVDLLFTFLLGIWTNYIFFDYSQKFHEIVGNANPMWALLLTSFLILMIASSFVRYVRNHFKKQQVKQLFFLTDDEIQTDSDDVLVNNTQAEHFARLVLESGSATGLVYGIDGPWGIGKSSFINLARNYWQQNSSAEVIFFRFEPLRYAMDPDLAERFIRDLSAEIQHQVFVPEFKTAVNRYARMLKGKADFSFLGFKISFDPTSETVDELLEDIDDVLTRMRRRLIIVVDDLDRLEAKAVNNVLFTIRRTFKLTQAAYILCYDTENLILNKGDAEQAREFLEKFVNIKFNLFVNTAQLCNFLRKDWSNDKSKFPSIPSETMFKLESILGELANILESKKAPNYIPLIGNMRKLKRFVNAVLMMQLEKINLSRTDFHRGDLINLLLIQINFPGTFRKIYAEEADGREGIFSIKSELGSGSRQRTYINDGNFVSEMKLLSDLEKYLLNQIFNIDSLQLNAHGMNDESVMASRACFNNQSNRNLENYLKLLVELIIPEQRETFVLYQNAVNRFTYGNRINEILSESEFDLSLGEKTHINFWRVLISQSNAFNIQMAEDSINTLVEYLPKYSSISFDDRGLRGVSIYNLIRLLDQAGWGHTQRVRRSNTAENLIEIADRIYGENNFVGKGLIDRLATESRGVLGLYDLMLFRLQCSADRMGQVYNLQNALIAYDDMSAPTGGLVNDLAIRGMRTLSQRIFALFKSKYIAKNCNIFDEVDTILDAELLGIEADSYFQKAEINGTLRQLENSLKATRSLTVTFIVY